MTLGLAEPLDLGIGVLPRAATAADLVGRPGRFRAATGDHEFDSAFLVRVDEGERAVALLSAPVRARFREALPVVKTLTLEDDAVRAALDAGTTAETAGRIVASLDEIASTIGQARRSVPAAAPLQSMRATWGRLAADEDLLVEDTPFRVEGTIRSCSIRLLTRRSAPGKYGYECALTAPWRSDGIRILPRFFLDRFVSALLGSGTPLGDSAFDAVFLAEGAGADVLTGSVRQAFLELSACAERVELRDGTLTLRGSCAPRDGESVPRLALLAVDALVRMRDASAAAQGPGGGPFR